MGQREATRESVCVNDRGGKTWASIEAEGETFIQGKKEREDERQREEKGKRMREIEGERARKADGQLG